MLTHHHMGIMKILIYNHKKQDYFMISMIKGIKKCCFCIEKVRTVLSVLSGFFRFIWVILGYFGFFRVLKFFTILSFFNKESLLFTSKNNFYTPCRVCGGLGAKPPGTRPSVL